MILSGVSQRMIKLPTVEASLEKLGVVLVKARQLLVGAGRSEGAGETKDSDPLRKRERERERERKQV